MRIKIVKIILALFLAACGIKGSPLPPVTDEIIVSTTSVLEMN